LTLQVYNSDVGKIIGKFWLCFPNCSCGQFFDHQ